jgi:hypothetical protein
MTVSNPRSTVANRVMAAAAVLAALAAPFAAAEAAPSRPLERKVRVMEKVLDAVLVDSPNVVVASHRATRGLTLDGYGALFTFEASLNLHHLDGFPDFGQMFELEEEARAEIEKAMAAAEVARAEADEAQREAEQRLAGRTPGAAPEPPRAPRVPRADRVTLKSSEEMAAERAKLVAGLKHELVDALIDYGGTLAELGDDSWVAVAAFLDGGRSFLPGSDDDGGRILVKARMRDLRALAAGRLSRPEMVAKVVVETD